jgi:hypothetical protein
MAQDGSEVGFGRALGRVAAAGAFAAALALLPLRALPPPAGANCAPAGAAVAVDDVAALLPQDVWIAAEGRGLGAVAGGWLDGALHRRIVESAAWKKFEQSPPHAQLLAALGFAELVSGMKPAALAAALLGEEIALGVAPDGDKPGWIAAVRTTDPDVAQHLVNVARGLASSAESGRRVRVATFLGVEATVLDEKLWFAAVDRQLLLASSEPLFEGLVERALAPAERRTPPPLLASLRSRTPRQALLGAVVDVKKIAATRPGGRLAPDKSDNFLGAMLAGDLVELGSRADLICASLDARGDELTLTIDVPGEPAALPDHFRSFGHARAQLPLALLAPEGTLLTWALRRDWARFWEDRIELCDPATEKEFADLKTNLGLFFGGRSLPDDVLPQLDDEILFVLSRQSYPGIEQPPKVRYPAGAFVYRARGDASKLGRGFAIGVHSLVALVNVDRAQKNQTPLLPFVDDFEGVTVYGGRGLTDDERPPDPVLFNVSPCACWTQDRIVLSSSEELLHSIVRELKKPVSGPAAPGRTGLAPAGCTSVMRVDGAALRALALDDREVLVSNAVLNEGKSQEEAEMQTDLLCEALAQLSHASLATRVEQGGMRVELRVALVTYAPAPKADVAPASAGGPR